MFTAETAQASNVTLNWSTLLAEKNLNTDELLEWVRIYPRRSDIHVVIPSKTRRLQRQLQSLGCTVTKMVCC